MVTTSWRTNERNAHTQAAPEALQNSRRPTGARVVAAGEQLTNVLFHAFQMGAQARRARALRAYGKGPAQGD